MYSRKTTNNDVIVGTLYRICAFIWVADIVVLSVLVLAGALR